MDIDTPIRLYIAFFLFWGLVFFTASEAGLFSLGNFKLQKLKDSGHPRSSLLENLLLQPRRLIITLLIGNEIFNIALSSLTTAIFISLWGEKAKWLAIVSVVGIILLFGEVIPKSLAIRNSERIAVAVAPWIHRFGKIIQPMVDLLIRLVEWILKCAGVQNPTPSPALTEEDFKRLIAKGEKEGILEEAEKHLVDRVFEFGDKTARTIMTPRSALFALPLETRVGEAVEKLKTYRFSRIPIYRQNLDEIVGILYAKDLLKAKFRSGRREERTIQSLLHKAYFVPLSKRLDELFKELQQRRIHMAIVVDEYGKVAGVVTLEDLLEELFGEIYDELDSERQGRRRSPQRRGRYFFLEGEGIL